MDLLQIAVAYQRIRCGIGRRIGLDLDLVNTAKVEELHPAEEIAGRPCITLPGQYDRIRAGAFGIDISKEIAELQGAPREIGPTRRYTLSNVLVNNGILYRRGRRKLFNYELPYDEAQAPWMEYDEVVLRSSFVGCHFFGHWLRDDCATHLLAERAGEPLSMPTPSWPDRVSYLALFGQSYSELARGRVKRLVLFDDISQNSHKAERFRTLRARVAEGRKLQTGDRIVYLMRGSGGKQRALLNETEVVEALDRRGVGILRAESLPVSELVNALFGARIVISVEGSQLSHALYTLREEGGILVIQPPDRFFNSHMDWARALNMRYGIVVGEKREAEFYLPTGDLMRTLDLMLEKLP